MSADPKEAKTIYEFSAKDIDGKDVSFDKYKFVFMRRQGLLFRKIQLYYWSYVYFAFLYMILNSSAGS
jgi:hypothetical protein